MCVLTNIRDMEILLIQFNSYDNWQAPNQEAHKGKQHMHKIQWRTVQEQGRTENVPAIPLE